MESFQPSSKSSVPRRGRPQSFMETNSTRGKTSTSNFRTTPHLHRAVSVNSHIKDTSTAKSTMPSTYKTPRHGSSMSLDPEIVFLERDITEVRANVIVCPVGPTLNTAKGISRAVMEKAGSGLGACFTQKRREGILPIGHTFVSGCFNLSKCTYIIHVVVPRMPENENPRACIENLKRAFDNCFQQIKTVQRRFPAGKGKVETLAIPALGAGTNKIPKELVAEVMCEAVHKFLWRREDLAPHLKKLFLVSLDGEMITFLKKEWDALIGPTRSSDTKDRGMGKSGDRTETVGARGGVTFVVRHHSDGRGSPSTTGYDSTFLNARGDKSSPSSSTWNHSAILNNRDDLTGGSPLPWHFRDELVGRGVTLGDRDSKIYPPSEKLDQSKGGDNLRSTHGCTSHDTDSDSDSKEGACGGAYGPKSRKGYPSNGKKDRPQENGYGYRSGFGRDFPASESAFSSVTDSKKFAQSVGHRRSDSDEDSYDENVKVTVDRAKSLTLKDNDSCPICFDPIVGKNSESMPMCGHKVCRDCWKELKLHNPICPVCRKVYGELQGTQPERALMTVKTDQRIHLPGFERFGTIVIDYVVPDGKQTEEHPNPGKPYKGTQRRAFLPDNAEGKEVLRLLERAFSARLIFTIGRSVTTGSEDVVTWNDIHHKTNISGPEFGYPDPTYLTRVKEELAAKGIK